MLINRLKSVFRYLSLADPLYKWRIAKGLCPACGNQTFLCLKSSDFMTRCIGCRANAVNLSLIPVIKHHFPSGVSRISVAYELSTYGATLDFLRKEFKRVYTSEYVPSMPMGQELDGVRNEDVQALTFPDNTFDLITSNAVLEHVPDDIQGFKECFRTLKSGGALIFSVPLYDTPETVRMAEISQGRIIFHREPEYHDARTTGPKSALTFWRHSMHDICDRVRMAGFHEVKLVDVVVAAAQGAPTRVVYARKA